MAFGNSVSPYANGFTPSHLWEAVLCILFWSLSEAYVLYFCLGLAHVFCQYSHLILYIFSLLLSLLFKKKKEKKGQSLNLALFLH